jgi:hypothetical protein
MAAQPPFFFPPDSKVPTVILSEAKDFYREEFVTKNVGFENLSQRFFGFYWSAISFL